MSTGYSTFEDWFAEQEGFSVRAERFDGDAAWLKAAFEAGRAMPVVASLISSQKQEIDELRYLISEVEHGDKVRDNQIEAAESRVLSLEEALRAIVERAKAASSGGSLGALSGLCGIEQIARNALKVNDNG